MIESVLTVGFFLSAMVATEGIRVYSRVESVEALILLVPRIAGTVTAAETVPGAVQG